MKTLEQALPTPSDLPVYLKLSMVTMIWGGTFVAGRILSDALAPLLAASLRFLLASVALLLFLALARIPLARPTLKQGVQLAVLGFFGILFYNLCFFYGLHYINASRASLIVALNPAVIGLASLVAVQGAVEPVESGRNRAVHRRRGAGHRQSRSFLAGGVRAGVDG